MSRRNGAANPEQRGIRVARAEKVSLVYVNIIGQNPSGVHGSTITRSEPTRVAPSHAEHT